MKLILVFLKLLLMHSSMLQLKSQPVKASAGNLSCYFIYQHVTWFQVFLFLFEALCHRGFEVVAPSGCRVPDRELCTVLHLEYAGTARKSAVPDLNRAGWNREHWGLGHIPARDIHMWIKKRLAMNWGVSNFDTVYNFANTVLYFFVRGS